jgi:hypothetical protein
VVARCAASDHDAAECGHLPTESLRPSAGAGAVVQQLARAQALRQGLLPEHIVGNQPSDLVSRTTLCAGEQRIAGSVGACSYRADVATEQLRQLAVAPALARDQFKQRPLLRR